MSGKVNKLLRKVANHLHISYKRLKANFKKTTITAKSKHLPKLKNTIDKKDF